MKKFNFIYMWLSGWCTSCLLCLYQPFTELVFGKEMLFPFPLVILFCLYFYVLKMGDIRSIYNEAKGLWWENRYRTIIEAVSNFVLNFVLGKLFGVYGIVCATLVSLFFINFVWGSSIIFTHYFTEIKMSEYYLLHLLYAAVTFVCCFITFCVCSKIMILGIIGFLTKMLICTVLSTVVLFVVYIKFPLYKISKEWIIAVLKNKVNKR